jgi:hypothetical protein
MALSTSLSPVLVSYLDDIAVPSSPTHSSMPSLENPAPADTFMVDPLQLRDVRVPADRGWPFLMGEASPWHSIDVEALMKLPNAVFIYFLDPAVSFSDVLFIVEPSPLPEL